MSERTALINKLFADEGDRKLACAFAEKFGDAPGRPIAALRGRTYL
jgi:hypothetical protein